MTTALGLSFVPSEKNHWGVYFGDWCFDSSIRLPNNAWKNPYASAIIHPYVPSDHSIVSFQDVYNKYQKDPKILDNRDNLSPILITQKDASNRILIYLDPKDLRNFSEVSTCCYSATKVDSIWEIQFKNLFPNTQLIPKEKCIFSPEQQFKIYFKRLQDTLKPYIAQLERNMVILKNLIGPHGNDGAIDKVEKEFEELGGQEAFKKLLVEKGTGLEKISRVKQMRYALENYLRQLVGKDYKKGTDESIASNSQFAFCQLAIEQLPISFDNQEKFEGFIQQSEVAKNNASESHDEVIPQDETIEVTEGIFDSYENLFRDPVSHGFGSDDANAPH